MGKVPGSDAVGDVLIALWLIVVLTVTLLWVLGAQISGSFAVRIGREPPAPVPQRAAAKAGPRPRHTYAVVRPIHGPTHN